MPALRVSASDLDAVRYWRAQEDAPLSDLLARLRRETPPTEAMLAGTAFHAALERAEPGEFAALSAEGHTFDMSEMEGGIALPTIRELKAELAMEVDGVSVTLVGKVDALWARTVTDHKLTSRFDPERFLNTYQWRVYLDAFDADVFRWNVFEGRAERDVPRRWRVTALHPLTMHRYPGMEDDVRREVAAFVSLAREHMPERLT